MWTFLCVYIRVYVQVCITTITEDLRMACSGYCRLSDNRRALDTDDAPRRSRVKGDRSLVLFVFLEDSTTAGGGRGAVGHCTTGYWAQQMERVSELRRVLDDLFQSQQKKFKQGHSLCAE